MKLDDTVCYCFHITKRKILNFIRIEKPRRASQISECGGAGTGCGWCRPFLVHFFEQMVVQGKEEPDEAITPEEYARLREKYLRRGRRHEAVDEFSLIGQETDSTDDESRADREKPESPPCARPVDQMQRE